MFAPTALILASLLFVLSIDRVSSSYAPRHVPCSSSKSYVREATSLSADESAYRSARQAKASASFSSWLSQFNSTFMVTSSSGLPTLALTSSGGGYRAMLSGGGVIEGLDAREALTGVSGVYQALTYQSGLSGGSWLLSSFGASNWATIASLRDNLWVPGLQNSLLSLQALLGNLGAALAIETDLAAKELAGYPPTLADPWGRLISYAILDGTDGGVNDTYSEWTSFSNYTSANVPFPIMTSLGVTNYSMSCIGQANSTQYEFSPVEWGSWDPEVNAFVPTSVVGTALSNGYPANGTCVAGYDQLGYIFATSSNLLNEACEPDTTLGSEVASAISGLETLISPLHPVTERDLYAVYPNPFYDSPYPSPEIASETSLTLIDGGESAQSNPIWPFLQPSRAVDVIIVNDNNADTTTNYPDGTQLHNTYLAASAAGLTKMPLIPTSDIFIANGYNTRATFFGCHDPSTATIIYLPNTDFSYDSGISTLQLQIDADVTRGIVANGVQIASQGGNASWPLCLACGLTAKADPSSVTVTAVAAAACAACLDTYCYN